LIRLHFRWCPVAEDRRAGLDLVHSDCPGWLRHG